MNKTRALKTAGLLLAGVLSLAAQDSGWQASGALSLPVGTAHDQMGLTLGIHFTAGYEFKTESGYGFRPGFGIGYFNGKGVTGVTADADAQINGASASGVPLDPSTYLVAGSSLTHKLTQIQIMMDSLIPITNKTKLVVGLSLNKYQVKVSAAPAGAYSPVGLDAAQYADDGQGGLVRSGNANGSASIPGIKFGLRLGFEHAFSKQWSGNLLFQQTELGRMVSKASALPTVNPAWLEFGFSYRF